MRRALQPLYRGITGAIQSASHAQTSGQTVRYLTGAGAKGVGSDGKQDPTIHTQKRLIGSQALEEEPVLSPSLILETDLRTMFSEIHMELESELSKDSELKNMATYYFDGKGKALRPVIALCIGHAFNAHTNQEKNADLVKKQRLVAIISEMIHTASLIHDDILDHAETRRGRASVNTVWTPAKSTFAGDYVLAVCSKLIARTNNQEVITLLSNVLTDLVHGELMQMQNKKEEDERFQDYIDKSFNKTASLMAYSCQANAVLSGATKEECNSAFKYGKHIGISFQLVDDLLDFVSSADLLGKPAAADLQLGLATAPVLFACKKFPELNQLISRRFSEPGDVEYAYECAIKSGLEETRELARNHSQEAMDNLAGIKDSLFKRTLAHLCHTVTTRIK